MGTISDPIRVLPIAAIFSREGAALDWATQRLSEYFGSVVLASPRLDFHFTKFYEREMGADLKKQLLALAPLADPADLPDWKVISNAWEAEYAQDVRGGLRGGASSGGAAPERPLNIDPGYVSEAKLVLASTKDRDHRLYIGKGVYAENTLFFHAGQWRSRPWTYPDYESVEYHEFFHQCRQWLRRELGRRS